MKNTWRTPVPCCKGTVSGWTPQAGGVETRMYKRQGLRVWDRKDLFTLEIGTTESQIDMGERLSHEQMGKHRNDPAPMAAGQSTQGPWAHLSGQPSQLLRLLGSVTASVTRPPFRILTTPAAPLEGPPLGSPLPPLLLPKGVRRPRACPLQHRHGCRYLEAQHCHPTSHCVLPVPSPLSADKTRTP